jgi:hypothetical protein
MQELQLRLLLQLLAEARPQLWVCCCKGCQQRGLLYCHPFTTAAAALDAWLHVFRLRIWQNQSQSLNPFSPSSLPVLLLSC